MPIVLPARNIIFMAQAYVCQSPPSVSRASYLSRSFKLPEEEEPTSRTHSSSSLATISPSFLNVLALQLTAHALVDARLVRLLFHAPAIIFTTLLNFVLVHPQEGHNKDDDDDDDHDDLGHNAEWASEQDLLAEIGMKCPSLAALAIDIFGCHEIYCSRLAGALPRFNNRLEKLSLSLQGAMQTGPYSGPRGGVNDQLLLAIGENCSELREFSADVFGVSGNYQHADSNNLAASPRNTLMCQRLSSFDVSGNSRISDISIRQVILNCPLLKVLNVSKTPVTDESIKLFVTARKGDSPHENIERIVIDSTYGGITGEGSINEIVKKCNTLRFLSIVRTTLEEWEWDEGWQLCDREHTMDESFVDALGESFKGTVRLDKPNFDIIKQEKWDWLKKQNPDVKLDVVCSEWREFDY